MFHFGSNSIKTTSFVSHSFCMLQLHVLMAKVLETMKSFDGLLTDALFNRIKEKTVKQMKNFYYSQPYSHAGQATDIILGPVRYQAHERVEAMVGVEIDDLRVFAAKVLKRTNVEMLVHGNATEEEAKRFLDVIVSSVNPKPLYPSTAPNFRVARLPRGVDYVYCFKCYNDQEANSCCQDIFQLETDTVASAASSYFLAHLINEPCFDILRTKETLGYIVFSGRKSCEQILNIHFIVQGDANPPDYLSSRIEAFLLTFRSKLEEMPDKEFLENREAVMEKLLEKDKNLSEESYRYFSQIQKGLYVFDKAKKMAEAVEKLSKADVLDLFDNYLAKGAPCRSKVSTRVFGKDVAMPIVEEGSEDEEGGGGVVIKELSEFKRGVDLWPLVQSPDLEQFEK